jgi:hypothetical protein
VNGLTKVKFRIIPNGFKREVTYHFSQNTNVTVGRNSALASKMGRINKILALYYSK